MLQYILKRILYFIPTFLMVSLIIFFLSKAAGEFLQCENAPYGEVNIEDCKQEARQKGYDKPIFYFTFSTAAHPDTLYKVFREERRNALHQLIGQYGNWSEITQYQKALQQFNVQVDAIRLNPSNRKGMAKLQKATNLLFVTAKEPVIKSQLDKIDLVTSDSALLGLQPQVLALTNAYATIKEQATPNKLLIPSINWYGMDNQYHFWITNFLSGNFGISRRDAIPVVDKIKYRLPWTLYLNIPAIIIAYLISIPLGIYTAVHRDTLFDKIMTASLLLFYSLPVFWIGTILVNFFTTPEYGMKWFPSIGLSGSELTWDNITRLMLPIFCVTYPALAFMTRQMRSSMLNTLQQDYIRTAKAKGLSESAVIWKHAFRNSLFPLITIFGSILPSAFAGSVIVELIFNIEGMGWLLLGSIRNTDWPVVYAILMITAILTMVGLLIADILYVMADPRVRLGKK